MAQKKLVLMVEQLNKVLGRPADAYTYGMDNTVEGNEGHILLDHNPTYGGYILRVMQKSTGESNFNGEVNRRSAKEMAAYLNGIFAGITLGRNL